MALKSRWAIKFCIKSMAEFSKERLECKDAFELQLIRLGEWMKKEHWIVERTLDLQPRRAGLIPGSAIYLLFDLMNYFTIIIYKADITISAQWVIVMIFINLHIISFIMINNHSIREKEILRCLLGFWQRRLDGW